MAPPADPGGWDVRFAGNEAARGWEELCAQAPGNTAAAWQVMRTDPVPVVHSKRHHRLSLDLATREMKGKKLEHWQIEVTGSGRIWYLVDYDTQTVWVDYAGCAHPRETG